MTRTVGSWLAACAAAAIFIVVGAATDATLATWTKAAGGGPQALTSARIFPATRTTVPVAIADNTNGGAETDTTDPYAVAGDGLTVTTTGTWPAAFSATRYLQFGYAFPGYAGPLPAATAASAATLDFTLTSPGTTTTFKVETRSIATGTLLGTHTSASYTVTGGTASFSIALPEVTTLDIASDLAVRVYEANAAKTTVTDRATVTVSSAVTSPATTWITYPMSVTDASTGVASTTPWTLAALDGTFYTTATKWPNTFKAADYMRWQFPATIVPVGAVVTSAQLVHSSKDANGVQFCYYFDVNTSAGATTATHGSSASPYCNLTAGFITDTISLPELTNAVNANAVALLNGMEIKMYGINTGGANKSLHDQLRLQVTWYLP